MFESEPREKIDYFAPRQDRPMQRDDRPRDRPYGGRDDRRFDSRRDAGRKMHFGNMERSELRNLVADYNKDWVRIGERLNKSPYECMKQFYFWDD